MEECEHLLKDDARIAYNNNYGLSLPSALSSAKSDPQTCYGWERIREMVQTKELLIHHIPDLEISTESEPVVKQSKWSDLHEYQYEYTLRECFFLTLVLLAIGVTGFSLIVEEWSIVDSLYFTLVMLSTIGYGDLSPSKPAGKLFASLFALGGIVILGLALGVVGSQLVEAEVRAAEKAREQTSKSIEKAFTRNRDERMSSTSSSSTISSLRHADSVSSHNGERNDFLEAVRLAQLQQKELSVMSRFISFAEKAGKKFWTAICMSSKYIPCVVPIFSGALVIAYIENWSWYDAVYFTIVSATTIGFGDLTPSKESSKLCAVFFIPFAVAAMGYILGQCASYLVAMRREENDRKLWTCNMKLEDIDALDENKQGGVNELEYIKYMLVAMKKVESSLFDELHDQFKQLDLTNTGLVTKKDLQLIAERRLKKASYKLQLSDYKYKLRKQSQRSMIHSALRRMSVSSPSSTETS